MKNTYYTNHTFIIIMIIQDDKGCHFMIAIGGISRKTNEI
jgi:hypothetical protein